MKNTINQEGAASLLFTLVMIIIISLLAIGFSVITTNDQKATLDKSVSLQAEYAAQSGINRVVEGIINHNSAFSKSSTATCVPATDGLIPTFQTPNNTKITCLKWSYSPQSLVYSSANSLSTIINPTDASGNQVNISEVDITWGRSNPSPLPLYLSLFDTASLSGVESGKFPILKIVTANFDMTQLTTTYVVPVSGTSSVVALGSPGINIIKVGCGTSPATSCTAKLKCLQWTANVANNSCIATNGGLLATSSFDGSQLSINISGIQSDSGAAVQFSNSQIQIDATAVSGSSVKRLIAGYTINQSSGWSPSFVAGSAQVLGKNYRYDFPSGNSATNAGPADPTNKIF
jgi:Tfp pilus assembly protein PilX